VASQAGPETPGEPVVPPEDRIPVQQAPPQPPLDRGAAEDRLSVFEQELAGIDARRSTGLQQPGDDIRFREIMAEVNTLREQFPAQAPPHKDFPELVQRPVTTPEERSYRKAADRLRARLGAPPTEESPVPEVSATPEAQAEPTQSPVDRLVDLVQEVSKIDSRQQIGLQQPGDEVRRREIEAEINVLRSQYPADPGPVPDYFGDLVSGRDVGGEETPVPPPAQPTTPPPAAPPTAPPEPPSPPEAAQEDGGIAHLRKNGITNIPSDIRKVETWGSYPDGRMSIRVVFTGNRSPVALEVEPGSNLDEQIAKAESEARKRTQSTTEAIASGRIKVETADEAAARRAAEKQQEPPPPPVTPERRAGEERRRAAVPHPGFADRRAADRRTIAQLDEFKAMIADYNDAELELALNNIRDPALRALIDIEQTRRRLKPPEPPTQPPPATPPKGRKSSVRKAVETKIKKLPELWQIIVNEGAIDSKALLEMTTAPKDLRRAITTLNKQYGFGVIAKKGGRAPDEVTARLRELGHEVDSGDLPGMIQGLLSHEPDLGAGKYKGFGEKIEDLAGMTTKQVSPGDLTAGQQFMTHDGGYWTVQSAEPGKIVINGTDHNGEFVIKNLDEFDVLPVIGEVTNRAEDESGPESPMATRPKTGDSFKDADNELRELLLTTGAFHVERGARTQAGLETAMSKEFGPGVSVYIPGLWSLMTRLPAFRAKIEEAKSGPKPARGSDVQQRPPGTGAGGGVQPAGRPGTRGPAVGVRAPPPAPTPPAARPEPPPTPAPPATKEIKDVTPTVTRTGVDAGIATISRELLPELTGQGKAFLDEYSTPERIEEMTQKFDGKRPMKHQIEQAARSIMAMEKGHAYINSDGTGTGKTLTTALVIDWMSRQNPNARMIVAVRNATIAKQWHADVLRPLGLRTHVVKDTFQTQPKSVNFVTFKRLEMLYTANNLGLVEGFGPDLLIFDESHALKNWYKDPPVKWAKAGEQITTPEVSKNVLFLSATPFESILHTGYLTRLKLWPVWTQWLEKTMDIRWNADKQRWEGLSPENVKKLHDALVKQGRMGKNEIDFANLKNSKGEKITLTSENFMVKLDEKQQADYDNLTGAIDGFINDAIMDSDRKKLMMLRGIQHFFWRSYDEAHKLPAAIERAKGDVEAGKTVAFFLLRKNDSSVEKWWARYEENPDRYPKGSKMPEILEALKGVTPPIEVPSPVRLIQDAFPDAVKITGDETAGGGQRDANIKAVMDGKAKVAIVTIAAGAEALNLQDKLGTHPRISYVVSTPYTASTTKQVAGRGFRLGSESNAEIVFLFNDTPSDQRVAINIAHAMRMQGAAIKGEVENPDADELQRFNFPELDRNRSNAPTSGGRESPMDDEAGPPDPAVAQIEAADEVIRESPPDPKTGKPAIGELFAGKPKGWQQEAIRKRLLKTKQKQVSAVLNPKEWEEGTLFADKARQTSLFDDPSEPQKNDRVRIVAGPEKGKTATVVDNIKGTLTLALGNGDFVDATAAEVETLGRSGGGEHPMIGPDPKNKPKGLVMPHKPLKPSGRPWLWTIWEKLGIKEKRRIKSRNEMMNEYLRNIGLKGFVGRFGFRPKTWRAFYRAGPGGGFMRRRTANDIRATVHESGHFLEEVLFGVDPSGRLGSLSANELRTFRGELLMAATPGEHQLSEGLAEFVAIFITDNARAQRVFPRFYPWFEERMQTDPRTDQILVHMETLRQEYEAHEGADWEEQFGAMFRSQNTADGRVPRFMPFRRIHRFIWWSGSMTEWLEKKAARAIGRNVKDVPYQLRPSKALILLSGRFDIIEHMIERGTFHPAKPGTVTGKGLLEIADVVGHQWKAFEMYTTALHAKNLSENLHENVEETIGIKHEWIKKTLDKYGDNAKFKRAAYLLEKYRRSILDFAEWGGLIDATHKKTMLDRYGDFRPLFRIMDEDLANRPHRQAGGARIAGLSTPIYRRKGSTRDIMPIFEAWQRYTFMTIDRAYKNRAVLSLVGTAMNMPGGGAYIHRVPMSQWPVGVDLTRVKQALLNQGVEQKQIDDAMAEDFMRVYIPSWMTPPAPYDWVYRKGKRELYYFDPDFYRLAEGMEDIHRSMIYRFFGAFARAKRGGIAVYTPTFWVWQVLPQIVSTAIQSESVPKYLKSLPGAFADVLFGRELAQKYKRAETGMATFMGLDQRALSRFLRIKMMKSSGEHKLWWTNPMNLIRYFMAYSAHAGMAFEIAPRLAATRTELKKAQTREEMMRAGAAARQSDIDWARQGILTRWITGLAPFFGSFVVGQERVAHEIKHHPGRLLWRMMIILGPPALAVWAWNRRDDESEEQWKNLPSYAKNQNWIINHPDPKQEPFQFRLPHEYGWFVAGLWATLDNMADKDPEVFKTLARDIVENFNPIPRAIPAALQSELEIWANETIHSGAPVYPEGRLPEYTYWPWTTRTAVDIGRATGIPPAWIEHEARGKLGTLGQGALQVADIVRGKEAPASQGPTRTPFAGRFRRRYPIATGEYVSRFYDTFKEAELVYRTGRLPELMMTGETGKLFKSKEDAIRIYASGRPVATALSTLKKVAEMALYNPKLTKAEKEIRVDELYRRRNKIAEKWWNSMMGIEGQEPARDIIDRVIGKEPEQ